MKYIKTFEKSNKRGRSYNVGDIIIWNHIDDSARHGVAIFARNVKFGDPCEVMSTKYIDGDPFVKAKGIKADRYINRTFNASGNIMNNYDGNWLEEYYFIPKDAFQWTIFSAVRSENINKTKKLIKEYPDLNIKDTEGNTPLFYAARINNLDITKLLIKNGADLNAEIRDMDNDLVYIIDIFGEENKNQLSFLYPEEYEKYLMMKNTDKYNL